MLKRIKGKTEQKKKKKSEFHSKLRLKNNLLPNLQWIGSLHKAAGAEGEADTSPRFSLRTQLTPPHFKLTALWTQDTCYGCRCLSIHSDTKTLHRSVYRWGALVRLSRNLSPQDSHSLSLLPLSSHDHRNVTKLRKQIGRESRGQMIAEGFRRTLPEERKSQKSGFVWGNYTAWHCRNSKGVGERGKACRAQVGRVAMCWT